MNTEQKTVAEFFAGIGLMRMRLEKAGWRTIWANDIDPDKATMYGRHFDDADSHFALEDVHLIEPHAIPAVTLATASFPCTDLSLAGGRRGLAGTGSGAFWGFIDAIRGMGRRKPPIILLENVTGFLTSHNGNDFRDACVALNELGYAVDAFIIDAAHFMPQSRQRLFVVGSKRRSSLRIQESRSFLEGPGRPRALADFIFWRPEIQWTIRPLPPLPAPKANLADIIEALPLDSRHWWSAERAAYLLNQMSARHRAKADAMISGQAPSYGTVFRRVRHGRSMAELRTDGIAGCLRTPRGGSGRQILFVAGQGQYAVRLLTPRECARLMGADAFKIDPELSLNKALFGFGDAVCVSVVEWIARNYLEPLRKELHESRDTTAYEYGKRGSARFAPQSARLIPA